MPSAEGRRAYQRVMSGMRLPRIPSVWEDPAQERPARPIPRGLGIHLLYPYNDLFAGCLLKSTFSADWQKQSTGLCHGFEEEAPVDWDCLSA